MPESTSHTSFSDLTQRKVLAIGDGYRAKLEELGGSGPYFLRAGALTERGFDWAGLESFRQEAQSSVQAKLGHAGDVVITTKGNSIGRVGWVPKGSPDFVYSPHLSYWRLLNNSILEPRYLYYWARSEYFTRQLHSLAFSTDMAPYFSLRDQAKIQINIPPVARQRAIADILGALDDKIAANDRILRLCVELSDAKFAHAVKSIQLDSETFGDIAEVNGGGTPKTSIDDYWNGDIPWATPTDVTALAGPYLFSTSRTITQAGLDSCSSALYPKGSILMTSRATIGAFAIAQSPVAVNQGFIVVNSRDPRYQLWLFHEMRARISEFISHANGATFLELSRGKFKQFRVRIPDVEFTHSFSQDVEALHAVASQMIIESANISSMRDELLPLLMSGKIRVRDAEKVVEGVV